MTLDVKNCRSLSFITNLPYVLFLNMRGISGVLLRRVVVSRTRPRSLSHGHSISASTSACSDHCPRRPTYEGMGAHAFGAAVRQRTVRQETTMARAGTLPSFLYQRVQGRLLISQGTSAIPSEMRKIETSSAGEEKDQEDESQTLFTLSEEANFLLGRVSTFGRAVWFNHRLMF